MIRTLTYCLLLFPFFGWGQFTMNVNMQAGGRPVVLNQAIQLNEQSFQLEQIRFYLSKFEFYQNNHLVARDSVEAYLVDFEIDSTRKLIFPAIRVSEIDEVRFLFGIDSITNTSGAMTGALDPMYGMYWSWQSGYINCKLEGTVLNPGKEAFQLHLGGYLDPFYGAQQITIQGNTHNVVLNIDLDPLMEEVMQSKCAVHVMSPGAKAVEYAGLLAKSFSLKP